MKTVIYSNAFCRDLHQMKKRGKDLTKLEAIIDRLVRGQLLGQTQAASAQRHMEAEMGLPYRTRLAADLRNDS